MEWSDGVLVPYLYGVPHISDIKLVFPFIFTQNKILKPKL